MPSSTSPHLTASPLLPPGVLTHIHTALLLSSIPPFLAPLISAPSSTLLNALPFLAALQFAYALLALPSPSSRAPKKRLPPSPLSSRIISTVLSLLLSLTLGTGVLYALLVLMGAPLTTHFFETMGCAAHMALLGAFPLVAVNGVDAEKWREVVAVRAIVDESFLGALGVCVGAWLGAIPIPLDWDREWQKWPVTIVLGVYGGYFVGKTLGSVFRGRKFPF